MSHLSALAVLVALAGIGAMVVLLLAVYLIVVLVDQARQLFLQATGYKAICRDLDPKLRKLEQRIVVLESQCKGLDPLG